MDAVPIEASHAAAAGAKARSSPWIRGPSWDAAWMLSALWLAPVVLLLSHGAADPQHGLLDTFYFGLTATFWLAHRLGTTWVAYMTTAYRPLIGAEPVRFLVVPAAIAAACFAIVMPADGALPWSRAERVVALVIFDYGLLTHHFAAQHFGALSLYRSRAGRSGERSLRRLDRLYATFVCGVLVFVAEIASGSVAFQDVWLDPLVDPGWIASWAHAVRLGAVSIVVIATLVMLAVEAGSDEPSLPRALYVGGIALMVLVAFGARSPFVFVVLWTAQHWLVATGLATRLASGEPAPADSIARRALHAVNRRPWALLLLLTTLSVLLLPVMEIEAVDDPGSAYAERLFGALASGLRTSTWAPLLVALGFTTAFLHYWLDRAVFRLSDPRVRTAARGLVSGPRLPSRGRFLDRGSPG